MSLPIRTTTDDIQALCAYLAKKPTGATVKEAKSVLDSAVLDGRKLNALKFWGLIEEQDDKLKATAKGREYVKSDALRTKVLEDILRSVPPYLAILERAFHRKEDALSTTDVAAHWHEHFKDDAGGSDKVLNDQAVCFFQLAEGAGLGTLIQGRHGHATRFSYNSDALALFCGGSVHNPTSTKEDIPPATPPEHEQRIPAASAPASQPEPLGQAIFIAHGKNKKPLEQLKKILEQFKIPYRVVTEEANLGRPISSKVREVMKSCNCAILIFTADEELKDKDGTTVWRPSENVVHELGATGYLYDNRIVIMKEDKVAFPSNFRDIGYITFATDQLEAKAMDILKELIGFGIVRVST